MISSQSFAQEFKVSRRDFQMNGQKSILDKSVIVTVNRFCELGKTFLTSEIQAQPKAKKFSAHESFEVELPKIFSIEELELVAREDKCVTLISKSIKAKLFVANDPNISKQNHLPAIQFGNTYEFFDENSKGTTVIAVIDNGTDIRHEDLKDNLWINSKEKNGLIGIDDDNNGLIDDVHGYDFSENTSDPSNKWTTGEISSSHGTHVSSLAAATTNNKIGTAGVATKNTKIMSLNVFGKSKYAQMVTIDKAIRYAADMGANVINMSLGGRGSAEATEEAMLYAISKGVFIVVAAGNSGEELDEENFYTPASYGVQMNGMIAVGAINSKNGELCKFSNRSTTYVELSAPGCNTALSADGIFAAFKKNTYGYMSGTSMASPIAAGMIAVTMNALRSKNKKINPDGLESFVKESSRSSTLLESYIQQGKTVDLETLKDNINSK